MPINFNNIGSGQVSGSKPFEPTASERAAPDSEAEASRAGDAVRLSRGAQTLKAAEESVAGLPEVDRGKVESIRQAIAEGRYHVDPVRLAEKFLELEGELSR